MLDRFESIGKIEEVGAPIFIAHGVEDEVVPATLGRTLFAAAREPKRAIFLPHTHHWIDPSSCFDQVSDFLDATLADPSPTH